MPPKRFPAPSRASSPLGRAHRHPLPCREGIHAANRLRASAASSAICALSASRPSNSASARMKAISSTSIRLAVKIAVEVEEIGLEQFLGRIEDRPDAEIGDAVEDAPVGEPAAHRIDAVARAQIVAERDVGGRIAELAAALVAMLDHALDRERPGQQARRGLAIAGAAAPRGSGSRRPARSPSSTGADRSTESRWPGRASSSSVDVAAAALAEGEVLAGHDAGRADPPHQPFGDEVGRGDRGEARRRTGRPASRRRRRRRTAARAGRAWSAGTAAIAAGNSASDADRRSRPAPAAPRLRRAIDGAADHRLVAEMKSVEIAERDDAAAKMGRNRRAPVQALHRPAIG